jgi:hypothetical protein
VAWSARIPASGSGYHASVWDGTVWQPLGTGVLAVGRYGPGFNGALALAGGATPTLAHVSTSSNGPDVDRALYVSQFK